MSYLYLDIEELCDERNLESVQFAMQEWKKTNSPSNYWRQKLRRLDYADKLEAFNMDFIITSDAKMIPWLNPAYLVSGLPMKEALRVCKEMYSKNIAKVTIEIAADQVTMTNKDIGVTFPEQLAIISTKCEFQAYFQLYYDHFQVGQSVSSLA